ncbi:hypothetical protein [Kordia zhangzhouensis]|uniref:hypothetical protein n=1 Tax=Kordia zhangzhouensis TaxID=1620405 RepID=UPI000629261D|nr:hypothetical protein [Kordia zhangzhouensis]
MKPKITLSFALCYLFFNFCAAQGKLNRAKEDLSGSSSSDTRSERSWNDDSDGNDSVGFFDDVFIEIAYHATVGIFFGNMETRYFYQYPYANGSHGEYAFLEEDGALKRSQLLISNTVFASGKEFYGNDIKVNFRVLPILGLEANHLHFFESRPDSELGISSFMLNFYRVREKYVTAFWGVGASYVGNGVDETGFAYQVGLEVFLNAPFSISSLWKQSLINNSSVDEFTLQAKYYMKRFAIHGGYRHYQLGSVTVNALGVGGEYRF